MNDCRFERELIDLGWLDASTLPHYVLAVGLGSIDDGPRRQLLAIAALRRHLDNAESDAVRRARAEHASWDAIGWRLNRHRQSVWRRYHDSIEPTP